MANTFLAGWAEVDLTPDKPVRLCGQFCERISEYVETNVYATALALKMGEEEAIFCSTDLVEVDLSLLYDVRERLRKMIPDFDASKVIISAIHTHTSVQYAGWNIREGSGLAAMKRYMPDDVTYVDAAPAAEGVMPDEEAAVWLADRIAEACAKAWKAMKPAKYANEFGRAAVGLNRRVRFDDGTSQMWGDTNSANFDCLEGGNDSGLELMYFFDENDKLTGVMANLACPAQAVQHRTFVSSDFWGKTKILIRKELGEDVFLLPQCSAAGDQCPVDLIRFVAPDTDVNDPNIVRVNPPKRKADPSMFDIQGSWKAGKRIANEIIEYLPDAKAEAREPKVLVHRTEQTVLPIRKVTLTEKAAAEKALKEYFAEKRGSTVNFYDSAAVHVYAGALVRFDYQQKHQSFTIDSHFLRLDDVAFATNPFELFLDFGNRIKAQSPAEQTFLIQLCNGSLGYVPTKRAEEGGHYSAYVSSGTTGHEGGDLIVRATLAAFSEMFGE